MTKKIRIVAVLITIRPNVQTKSQLKSKSS